MSKRYLIGGLVAMAGLAVLAAWSGTFANSAWAGNGPIYEISLDPAEDTNNVGTDHTVTATVTISGDPLSDALVSFSITDGPNADAGGDCSDNVGCTTDSNGEVSFTYTSNGDAGQDAIEACITQLGPVGVLGAQQLPCDTATKDWVQPTPTPTPTPSPTPTPTQVAPAAQLPETGTQPPAGSDFPWFLAAAFALGALTVAAGAVVLRRRAH
jgi:hypothetical protein